MEASISNIGQKPNHNCNLWKLLSDFRLVSLLQDLIKGPKDQVVPFKYKENKALLSFFYTCTTVYNTMCKFKVTKTEIKMGCIERDKTHQVLTFKSVY